MIGTLLHVLLFWHFVMDTISNSERRHEQFINLKNLREIYKKHLNGENHKELIWSSLMILSWQNNHN